MHIQSPYTGASLYTVYKNTSNNLLHHYQGPDTLFGPWLTYICGCIDMHEWKRPTLLLQEDQGYPCLMKSEISVALNRLLFSQFG